MCLGKAHGGSIPHLRDPGQGCSWATFWECPPLPWALHIIKHKVNIVMNLDTHQSWSIGGSALPKINLHLWSVTCNNFAFTLDYQEVVGSVESLKMRPFLFFLLSVCPFIITWLCTLMIKFFQNLATFSCIIAHHDLFWKGFEISTPSVQCRTAMLLHLELGFIHHLLHTLDYMVQKQ